jgi:hypothetical protein
MNTRLSSSSVVPKTVLFTFVSSLIFGFASMSFALDKPLVTNGGPSKTKIMGGGGCAFVMSMRYGECFASETLNITSNPVPVGIAIGTRPVFRLYKDQDKYTYAIMLTNGTWLPRRSVSRESFESMLSMLISASKDDERLLMSRPRNYGFEIHYINIEFNPATGELLRFTRE